MNYKLFSKFDDLIVPGHLKVPLVDMTEQTYPQYNKYLLKKLHKQNNRHA